MRLISNLALLISSCLLLCNPNGVNTSEIKLFGPKKYNLCAVMGKVEGEGESWHGHVTAVTVAPEYRRQQLAKKLMNLLEDISDKM